jgi:hypothetical protein
MGVFTSYRRWLRAPSVKTWGLNMIRGNLARTQKHKLRRFRPHFDEGDAPAIEKRTLKVLGRHSGELMLNLIQSAVWFRFQPKV